MVGKGSCIHLESHKKNDIEMKYVRVLHQMFVVSSDHESKIAKLKNAFCYVCKQLGPYMHTCIHCVFFGCHKHIRDHANGKLHCFTMELNYGQLHCIRCNDYVYDSSLDKIAYDNTMNAKKCSNRVLNWCASVERDMLNLTAKRISITPESTRGLRGLLNLGNTCFINCIVQVLVHTPLLREYFLSDRHKCKGPPTTCLVCELSRLFQEFYSGQCMPLELSTFVHMIWLRATSLAGDQQQDAHHLFIATLDALHQECPESTSSIQSLSSNKCQCIIDQIFSGLQQSDVVCKLCRAVSTKIDPLWDISLELGHTSTLIDCLQRFTATEQVVGEVLCSNCESLQESTKQLTVKTLPNVLCFHLQRLKLTSYNKKIDTKVAFPEMLDMTPFMSRNKESLRSVIPADNRYSLFGVVQHIGGPTSGHYIAYIRHQRDFWYKCSDCRISRATIDQVLGSEGYLLFYHKHILGYE